MSKSTESRTVIGHAVCLNPKNEPCTLREALQSQAAKSKSSPSSSSEQNAGFRQIIVPETHLGSPAQAEVVFSIDALFAFVDEEKQAAKLHLVVTFESTGTTASSYPSSMDSSRPVSQEELVHDLKHRDILGDLFAWTDLRDTMREDEVRFDQDTFHVLAGHRDRLIDGLRTIELEFSRSNNGGIGFSDAPQQLGWNDL
ncbi:hypothetical protein EHS25_003164 [Saitozyma podzolica]|uniref:Uncharacterized protein n=1 Tax=Saitozyma podzolica TaxID=1890683 RepID=A0A427Y850_9TREE|nr:hypothetical protein EHS25_003164 [Saitozyma podzolica]